MALVHGVGVNDADYKTHKCRTVNGVTRSYWRCPFYKVWAAMLERAYSEKSKLRNPTYKDVSVVEQWHVFSVFKAWMELQPWEGNELDKDILVSGNKIYGPDYCVFVPCQLNSFMNDSKASRGALPIGVAYDAWSGKYKAACRNPFSKKVENLGRFTDPIEAHKAWKRRKNELACIYAGMQSDERLSEALRNRFIN